MLFVVFWKNIAKLVRCQISARPKSKPLFFKARDNFANQTTLNSVGFSHDEKKRGRHERAVFEGDIRLTSFRKMNVHFIKFILSRFKGRI